MNRSLFTGFLFLPFGTSVHIWDRVYQEICKGPEMLWLHLLHVLEHLWNELVPDAWCSAGTYHVAVPIKSLDPRQQLLVISQRDQHLGMISNRLLEDGQWSLADLVFLERSQLSLIQLGFWDVYVLTGTASWLAAIHGCDERFFGWKARTSWWTGESLPGRLFGDRLSVHFSSALKNGPLETKGQGRCCQSLRHTLCRRKEAANIPCRFPQVMHP